MPIKSLPLKVFTKSISEVNLGLFKVHALALSAARKRYENLCVEFDEISYMLKSEQEEAYDELLERIRRLQIIESSINMDDNYTYYYHSKGRSLERVRKLKAQLDEADSVFEDIENLEFEVRRKLSNF